jgi:hypothetical protein
MSLDRVASGVKEMAKFNVRNPAEMTTDEIVELRGLLRKAIKFQESKSFLTVQEMDDLKRARAYLRQLMKESGTRFIQRKLL